MLRVFLRSTILRFGEFARWGDLVLGIVTIALGFYWSLWWVIGLGVLSMLAFVFNLNGRIQAWAKGKAIKHVEKRRSH